MPTAHVTSEITGVKHSSTPAADQEPGAGYRRGPSETFMLFAASIATRLLLPVASASSIAAPANIAGPDSGPATADPAAVFFNPAAIAPLGSFQALIDAQVSFVHIDAVTTRHDGLDPNTCSDASDPTTCEAYDPAVADVPVPVFLAAVTYQPWKDRLTLGVAATDNFVGGGDYSKSTEDPTHVWTRYQGINTKIVTIGVTGAVGLTVVDGVHVGGGGTFVLDMIAAYQASDPLGTEGRGFDGTGYSTDVLLTADASGHHATWNAGLFFDRWKEVQVGASYTSGGTFHAEGDASLDVPEFLSTTGGITVPGQVTVNMPLPAVIRVGLASQVTDDLKLGATLESYQWGSCCGDHDGDIQIDVVNEAGVQMGPDDGIALEVPETSYNPRRLWSALNVSVNGGYQVAPRVWLGGRVGWDQYAVPDEAVSPTNLDFTAWGLQGAARVRVAGPLTLGLSYTHFFLGTRTITDAAWDVRDDTDPAYEDEYFSPKNPYVAGTNGTYSGHVNTVGLRVGVDLDYKKRNQKAGHPPGQGGGHEGKGGGHEGKGGKAHGENKP